MILYRQADTNVNKRSPVILSATEESSSDIPKAVPQGYVLLVIFIISCIHDVDYIWLFAYLIFNFVVKLSFLLPVFTCMTTLQSYKISKVSYCLLKWFYFMLSNSVLSNILKF